MAVYHSQIHPATLIGTLAQRPPSATVQKEGVEYFATDTTETYLSVIVGGNMTWVLEASGSAGITGSGTPNRVAKFVTPGSIGDGQAVDDGASFQINAATFFAATANAGPITIQAAGVANAASLQSAGGVAQVQGATGVNIIAVTGSVVAATDATSAVSIQNPNANVTVGSGGGANIDINAIGSFLVAAASISLNGMLFLGSHSVATLPVGISQATAFATDVRNLDSGAVYPTLQVAGTGGFVVRFTDGVWRLSGTNIVAVA